jgi:selenocysteine lyase/cysteine desulfurase
VRNNPASPLNDNSSDRFNPGFTSEAVSVGKVALEILCRRLAEAGFFATHGEFYATTAVSRLGAPEGGLVRVGCACYTTDEENDRLLAVVRGMQKGR